MSYEDYLYSEWVKSGTGPWVDYRDRIYKQLADARYREEQLKRAEALRVLREYRQQTKEQAEYRYQRSRWNIEAEEKSRREGTAVYRAGLETLAAKQNTTVEHLASLAQAGAEMDRRTAKPPVLSEADAWRQTEEIDCYELDIDGVMESIEVEV